MNRFGKIDWKTMYAEADKLLAKLNLRFKSDRPVGDLSIGDQQMVEIAKVLSFESKVIIMDEPTDALTDTETESLFRVIRELKAQGRGIVYISHRMKDLRNLRRRDRLPRRPVYRRARSGDADRRYADRNDGGT